MKTTYEDLELTKLTEDIDTLTRSIKHWVRIDSILRSPFSTNQEKANGLLEEGYGCAACALCQKYMMMSGNCGGCPIYETTRVSCCGGTPYVQATAQFRSFIDSPANKEPPKEEAYRMLEYLRGLLSKLIDKKRKILVSMGPSDYAVSKDTPKTAILDEKNKKLVALSNQRKIENEALNKLLQEQKEECGRWSRHTEELNRQLESRNEQIKKLNEEKAELKRVVRTQRVRINGLKHRLTDISSTLYQMSADIDRDLKDGAYAELTIQEKTAWKENEALNKLLQEQKKEK